MKATAFSVLALIVGALSVSSFSQADEPPDGKAVFLAQKCNLCHSIEVAGIEKTMKSDKIKAPDLTDVVAGLERDWVMKYVRKEVDKEGKPHPKEVKIEDADLGLLIDWLVLQKKAE